MTETKHTPKAKNLTPDEMVVNAYANLEVDDDDDIRELRASIDRLKAEVDGLEAASLRWSDALFASDNKIKELEAEKAKMTVYLRVSCDQVKELEAEKAELVEAHQAISSLHGNMPLDSIEKIGGINDGKDRAVKLRAAIEISRAILAKHEPKPREV